MDLGCAYTTKIVLFCGKNNKFCRFDTIVKSKISIFATNFTENSNYDAKDEESFDSLTLCCVRTR